VRTRFVSESSSFWWSGPACSCPLAAQNYDLVHRPTRRVIDPESGLDGVPAPGVRAGKVVSISETPLAGQQQNRCQRPGTSRPGSSIFIHTGRRTKTYRCQALDGVTTAFELEVGTGDIDGWYAAR
jgi:hypothetical protein